MRTDIAALEMTEALIAAHKAALRARDTMALSLIEPLLRHAGQVLAAEFAPIAARAPRHRGRPLEDSSPPSEAPLVN